MWTLTTWWKIALAHRDQRAGSARGVEGQESSYAADGAQGLSAARVYCIDAGGVG
jgi:hypothetical protein